MEGGSGSTQRLRQMEIRSSGSALPAVILDCSSSSGGCDHWFPHHFYLGELLGPPGTQLTQHVTQQWTVAPADLLTLHAHPKLVDQILHLRLHRNAHLKHVQHVP